MLHNDKLRAFSLNCVRRALPLLTAGARYQYLEIYNPTGVAVDLSEYAFPNTYAGGIETPGVYDWWQVFEKNNMGEKHQTLHLLYYSA